MTDVEREARRIWWSIRLDNLCRLLRALRLMPQSRRMIPVVDDAPMPTEHEIAVFRAYLDVAKRRRRWCPL